jgi:hypothetical protein
MTKDSEPNGSKHSLNLRIYEFTNHYLPSLPIKYRVCLCCFCFFCSRIHSASNDFWDDGIFTQSLSDVWYFLSICVRPPSKKKWPSLVCKHELDGISCITKLCLRKPVTSQNPRECITVCANLRTCQICWTCAAVCLGEGKSSWSRKNVQLPIQKNVGPNRMEHLLESLLRAAGDLSKQHERRVIHWLAVIG